MPETLDICILDNKHQSRDSLACGIWISRYLDNWYPLTTHPLAECPPPSAVSPVSPSLGGPPTHTPPAEAPSPAVVPAEASFPAAAAGARPRTGTLAPAGVMCPGWGGPCSRSSLLGFGGTLGLGLGGAGDLQQGAHVRS